MLTRGLRLARRWAAFLLLLASLIPALVFRSWIDAQAAAFVVLATTVDKPVLSWIAAASTDAPRISETRIASQETTIARPGSGGRTPAVVFVNGATERGHLHPEVQRLARGLARAGFTVVVPELPGLRRGEITLRTLSTLVTIARVTADEAEDRKVGLVGVSVGASLALVAAEEAALDGRVSAIAGIAPFADLRNVARIATTGSGYDSDDFVQLAVARSLGAGLPPSHDRRRLLAALAPIPNERDDPLAGVTFPRDLGPAASSLVRLLRNDDEAAFDELWAQLPRQMRDAAARLSPASRAQRLRMPIELATSPRDDYFPVSESRTIARIAPNVHVTVTESLSHALPELSLDGIGAALAFNGFTVRSLRALR